MRPCFLCPDRAGTPLGSTSALLQPRPGPGSWAWGSAAGAAPPPERFLGSSGAFGGRLCCLESISPWWHCPKVSEAPTGHVILPHGATQKREFCSLPLFAKGLRSTSTA